MPLPDSFGFIITAGATLTAAGVAVIMNWQINRMRATIELIHKVETDGDYIQARSVLLKVMKLDPDDRRKIFDRSIDQKVTYFSDMGTSDIRSRIQVALNQNEIYALGVRRNILDVRTLRLWHKTAIIRDYEFLQKLSEELPEDGWINPYYSEFSQLAQHWQDGKSGKPRHWRNSDPITRPFKDD